MQSSTGTGCIGAVDQADKLGVVGHVENTSSGTVTGEVQGESQPVAQMKV